MKLKSVLSTFIALVMSVVTLGLVNAQATPTATPDFGHLPTPLSATALPQNPSEGVFYVDVASECMVNFTLSCNFSNGVDHDFFLLGHEAVAATGDKIEVTQDGKALVGQLVNNKNNHTLWVVANNSPLSTMVHIKCEFGCFIGLFQLDPMMGMTSWDPTTIAALRDLQAGQFLTSIGGGPDNHALGNCSNPNAKCDGTNVIVAIWDTAWHTNVGFYTERHSEGSPYWFEPTIAPTLEATLAG